MFNLLRMDLYRLKRSKSVYVCFGVLVLMTITTAGMIWLTETPQGQQIALKLEIMTEQQVQEEAAGSGLSEMNTQQLFRQMGLNGGTYSCVLGIWLMLFVCMDYQSGFIKTIMVSHQNRWNYIGSRFLTAGIVNMGYLALQYVAVLVLNRIFDLKVVDASLSEILFYTGWSWFVTTAFAALVILVCVFSKSVAAGTLAVVLFGSGTFVMPLYFLLRIIGIGEWTKYTIYRMLSEGPDCYTGVKDLYVYAAGAVLVAVYAVLAGIVLKRQDIPCAGPRG